MVLLVNWFCAFMVLVFAVNLIILEWNVSEVTAFCSSTATILSNCLEKFSCQGVIYQCVLPICFLPTNTSHNFNSKENKVLSIFNFTLLLCKKSIKSHAHQKTHTHVRAHMHECLESVVQFYRNTRLMFKNIMLNT